MKTIYASDFGAHGDGISDSRAAIQAALNSASPGDMVVLTTSFGSGGLYMVGNADAIACLRIPAGVWLTGETPKARILAAPGIPGSVRIIDITDPEVTVSNLTLDGNAELQPTPNEHMHGLMTRGARTIINDVTAVNCCGDGFYAYTGAFDLSIIACAAALCGRNGITLSGEWSRGVLRGNRFTDNDAQQIDSEASVITDLLIEDNTVSKVGATDHVFTVSGRSQNERSSRWLIRNNQVDGGIRVTWADDIEIYKNKSDNRSIRPCVSVYRTCKNIRIRRNEFTMTQTTDATTGVITVSGTAEGGPARVIIEDNDLKAKGHPHSFGVRCEGAVSVQVIDNTIDGPGIAAPGGAGVYIRATSEARKFESAIIAKNKIRDFGQFGVNIMGNLTAELAALAVVDNVFDDGAGVMTAGISLDPCAKEVLIGPNLTLGRCLEIVDNAASRALKTQPITDLQTP